MPGKWRLGVPLTGPLADRPQPGSGTFDSGVWCRHAARDQIRRPERSLEGRLTAGIR